MGDTDNTPYGGGTWASRAAGIGGEAGWQAGKALRAQVLKVAATILQADPRRPRHPRRASSSTPTPGASAWPLDEVARIAYFRPDTLPPGFQAELIATRHYVPRDWPFALTNGIQASYLEVDPDTGFVKLLKHWCVEDCGTVINPQLVDEQVRGGIVQGLGGALFEHCVYDERGQMLNANMADYLVPMAVRDAGYRSRPLRLADRRRRARRQGRGRSRHRRRAGRGHECGQRRAAPLGANAVTAMPITPDRVLEALGKI